MLLLLMTAAMAMPYTDFCTQMRDILTSEAPCALRARQARALLQTHEAEVAPELIRPHNEPACLAFQQSLMPLATCEAPEAEALLTTIVAISEREQRKVFNQPPATIDDVPRIRAYCEARLEATRAHPDCEAMTAAMKKVRSEHERGWFVVEQGAPDDRELIQPFVKAMGACLDSTGPLYTCTAARDALLPIPP